MCVILEKQAGKEIPFEHLLAGAHRNADGYGVAVVDRGKLEVIRGYSKSYENAADAVQRVLKDAKDQLAFVHFRYRTQGDVSIDNVMPFEIFKTGDNHVAFLHNGTMNEFKGGGKDSDSKIFCETLLSPLLKRSAALLGSEHVLTDPVVAAVLKQFANGGSKFALVDSHGNSMVINRTAGAEQPYGWASNSYSLSTAGLPKKKEHNQGNFQKNTSTVHLPGIPSSSNGGNTGTGTTTNVVSLSKELDSAKRTNKPSPSIYHPTIRQTVHDLTGYDLKAFCYFDADQIRQMVKDQPDLSAVLILDLLAAVYSKDFSPSVKSAA